MAAEIISFTINKSLNKETKIKIVSNSEAVLSQTYSVITI